MGCVVFSSFHWLSSYSSDLSEHPIPAVLLASLQVVSTENSCVSWSRVKKHHLIKRCTFCLIADHSWKVDKDLCLDTLNLSCMKLRCFPIRANPLFLKVHSILSCFFCLIYHKQQIHVQGIKTVLTYIFKHQVIYTLTCNTLNKTWQSSQGYLENG